MRPSFTTGIDVPYVRTTAIWSSVRIVPRRCASVLSSKVSAQSPPCRRKASPRATVASRSRSRSTSLGTAIGGTRSSTPRTRATESESGQGGCCAAGRASASPTAAASAVDNGAGAGDAGTRTSTVHVMPANATAPVAIASRHALGGGSQVQYHVALRLRAADQRAAVGGGLHRIRAVADGAGDERRLAGVADPGATGPADGHVARLGKLEDAGVVAAPRDGEVAAGELDRRAGPGRAGRRVRRHGGRRGDAGGDGGRRPERLRVDARGVETDRRQAGADLVHERSRPAQVRLRIGRRVELGEQRGRETADAVEVAALAVAGGG